MRRMLPLALLGLLVGVGSLLAAETAVTIKKLDADKGTIVVTAKRQGLYLDDRRRTSRPSAPTARRWRTASSPRNSKKASRRRSTTIATAALTSSTRYAWAKVRRNAASPTRIPVPVKKAKPTSASSRSPR